jgi:hypothetical protein
MLEGPCGSITFKEGILLVGGRSGGTSLGLALPLTKTPSEVAATRSRECVDLFPTITTGDSETDGVNVSLGPPLVAEGPVTPTTRPLLRLLVEVRLRLTADVEARCARRRGGGR